MALPRVYWKSKALALALVLPYTCTAGPAASVNVALQASFNAPPYILELLLVSKSTSVPKERLLI